MSTSLSPRHDVAILPSLPPSPSFLEEVFSHPHSWSVRLDEFDLSAAGTSRTKGKQKQPLQDDDEDEDEDEDAQHRVSTHKAYPPMSDKAAETQRVEETLRRWDLAERRRRKSLRESAHHTAAPSLLSSVTHTASLVLSGRNPSISTSIGPSSTRAFKSHEAVDVTREGYAVPLDDIDPSNTIAVHSPSLSVFDRNTSMDAGRSSTSRTSENPFVHPSEHTPVRSLTPTASTLRPSTPPSPSPFADARRQQADLSSSKRSSGSREPLVQPPPPPPPEDKPRVMPPQPTSQPVLRPLRREDPEESQEVRWWHDWLCGCGEGPDRGGDNQAGRTNPFE